MNEFCERNAFTSPLVTENGAAQAIYNRPKIEETIAGNRTIDGPGHPSRQKWSGFAASWISRYGDFT
jgi:hypothetical protein